MLLSLSLERGCERACRQRGAFTQSPGRMRGQEGNLRKQLVKGGDCVSFQATQGWICENCRLQFLVIEDNRTRTLAEHFIIAVLKPKYVDEGRRESALEEA